MASAKFRALPNALMDIVYEFARHILRRPVVGVLCAARTKAGEWVLVRRADTGTWALPGGTVEWGETLRETLVRELEEEAGILNPTLRRVVGVFSAPRRDPRFHAVNILVECEVDPPTRAAKNPLEIREVKVFPDDQLPHPLAMGLDALVDATRAGGPTVIE